MESFICLSLSPLHLESMLTFQWMNIIILSLTLHPLFLIIHLKDMKNGLMFHLHQYQSFQQILTRPEVRATQVLVLLLVAYCLILVLHYCLTRVLVYNLIRDHH